MPHARMHAQCPMPACSRAPALQSAPGYGVAAALLHHQAALGPGRRLCQRTPREEKRADTGTFAMSMTGQSEGRAAGQSTYQFLPQGPAGDYLPADFGQTRHSAMSRLGGPHQSFHSPTLLAPAQIIRLALDYEIIHYGRAACRGASRRPRPSTPHLCVVIS